MVFSKNFERDYKLYSANRFNFSACDIKEKYNKFKYSENGKTAKECFYILDSTGKYEECSELDMLYNLLNCKASLNLQIKLWAEEIEELLISKEQIKENTALAIGILLEIQKEYQLPEWVIKAITKQTSYPNFYKTITEV
jgi:hypothetical protein